MRKKDRLEDLEEIDVDEIDECLTPQRPVPPPSFPNSSGNRPFISPQRKAAPVKGQTSRPLSRRILSSSDTEATHASSSPLDAENLVLWTQAVRACQPQLLKSRTFKELEGHVYYFLTLHLPFENVGKCYLGNMKGENEYAIPDDLIDTFEDYIENLVETEKTSNQVRADAPSLGSSRKSKRRVSSFSIYI
jgi:hypothetical protein